MTSKKVLIYADPHPIRNSHLEFLWPAKFLRDAFSSISDSDVEWKVFSNKHILDELAQIHGASDRWIYPTADETKILNESLYEWTSEQISIRSNIIAGNGDQTSFYLEILERIKKEFDFEMVFLWSENGLVRAFAERHGIDVFHCELGPTRKPFPETFYVDRFGTNGSAALSDFKLGSYSIDQVVPAETWLSLASGANKDEESVFELISTKPEHSIWSSGSSYIIIALQLADDLNMIDHSTFNSPREFLEYVLPPLVEHGFHVLVKGHPSASLRPGNLIKEIEALNYAKGFEKVEVLDRHLSTKDYLALAARSTAVVSINSSVSLEAHLFNVAGVVYGRAAFDVEGQLLEAGQKLLTHGKVTINNEYRAALLSLLFCHYLHPLKTEVAGTIFRDLCLSDGLGHSKLEYVQWLIKNVNHGTEYLEEEIRKTHELDDAQTLARTAIPVDHSFYGHVDKVTFTQNETSLACEVQGWVGRSEAGDIILVGIKFASDQFVPLVELFPRNDVRSKYPSISEKCGFRIKTNLPSDTPETIVNLVFVSSTEAFVHPVLLKNIQAPAESALEEVLPETAVMVKRAIHLKVRAALASIPGMRALRHKIFHMTGH